MTSLCFWTFHDDVIKWKPFPRYWPFVRGIHRSPLNSPHKGQWRGALMFSLICVSINGWVNNGEAQWFETLSCPLWRHCDVPDLNKAMPQDVLLAAIQASQNNMNTQLQACCQIQMLGVAAAQVETPPLGGYQLALTVVGVTLAFAIPAVALVVYFNR